MTTNPNPRVYHSFWSKPLLEKRFERTVIDQLESTLLFTAIGVAYAKKLNLQIVLHTDDFGVEIFGFLPYDKIYRTLNGHDIHRALWASGKMIALAHEPLGSCHLDMDAWIKKTAGRDFIFNNKKDLVTQNIEDSLATYEGIKKIILDNVDLTKHINLSMSENHRAYNCGLIRLNNQKLKDKWLKAYWDITDTLNRKQPHNLREKYCIPDLISEQWMLYQICQQNNFSVDTICNGWNDKLNPKKLGYTHLISEGKYKVDDRLKEILRNLDAELYTQVINKIRGIEKWNFYQ